MLTCQVTIVTSSLFNFQRLRRLIRDGHCITVAPRSVHSPGGPPTLFQNKGKRLITLAEWDATSAVCVSSRRIRNWSQTANCSYFTSVAPRHVWQVLLVRIHREMVRMEMRVPLFRKRSLAIPSVPRDCQLGAKGSPPGFPLACVLKNRTTSLTLVPKAANRMWKPASWSFTIQCGKSNKSIVLFSLLFINKPFDRSTRPAMSGIRSCALLYGCLVRCYTCSAAAQMPTPDAQWPVPDTTMRKVYLPDLICTGVPFLCGNSTFWYVNMICLISRLTNSKQTGCHWIAMKYNIPPWCISNPRYLTSSKDSEYQADKT